MRIIVQPIEGRLSTLLSVESHEPFTGNDYELLDYCQKMGEVFCGYIDGQLVCCWGLIPPSFLSMEAYLWMWAGPRLREHQFLFIRNSQRQVENMLLRYPKIVGHCTAGSHAIRWLKWLGAEFHEPEGNRVPFVIRRRENG